MNTTITEKEYLVEAVKQQLNECNDIELLYLINSLLANNK